MKTKKNIHKALLILLTKKTLSQIKVTELCREAAINRGTFYFHYEEVGDVFEELFEDIMLDLKQSYEEPYKNGFANNIQYLDPKTVKIFDHVKKHEDFYKIVLSENVVMKYYYMLYDHIYMLSHTNTFEEDNGMKERFYNSYGANAIIGLIIEWYRNDFINSVEEMNELLVNIVNQRYLDELKQ